MITGKHRRLWWLLLLLAALIILSIPVARWDRRERARVAEEQAAQWAYEIQEAREEVEMMQYGGRVKGTRWNPAQREE